MIVLNDINFAGYHADRIVAMKEGRVLTDGLPQEILTAATIEEIFDLIVPVHLVDATPVVAYFAVGNPADATASSRAE